MNIIYLNFKKPDNWKQYNMTPTVIMSYYIGRHVSRQVKQKKTTTVYKNINGVCSFRLGRFNLPL